MPLFAIGCVALIAAGTFVSIRLHTVFDKHAEWTRDAEGRFLAVQGALPPRGKVAFLSTLSEDTSSALRLQAQYALVPRIVVGELADASFAIAVVKDAESAFRLAAQKSMKVVQISRDGTVAVLKK